LSYGGGGPPPTIFGELFGMWYFEKPKGSPSGWTTPLFAKINVFPSYANFINATTGINVLYLGELRPSYAICEVTEEATPDATALGEDPMFQKPDPTGAWTITYIGVACSSRVFRGFYGYFYDWWFVPASLPTGDYLRGSGEPYRFVVLGNMLQPFDGTVIKL
jgi:hypothetical protein